jgi:hypothetical protein
MGLFAFLERSPRIALRSILGYYHPLPPGEDAAVAIAEPAKGLDEAARNVPAIALPETLLLTR